MDQSGGIHLKRLHAHLENVVHELVRTQFWRFQPPGTWRPALNVYRCEDHLVVCADLAGVDKAAIELQVEARRLVLRGRREVPEPDKTDCRALETLAMEIDYGAFEREVLLPADVDAEHASAEQKTGLLWVYLPFQSTA